ncbi:hypothetical protein BV898_16368 [Hypsibius exemplaris]|uniref:G-protein coupled receptors family 1 profile domain-containing protein n=1 Tax=Hypsibius exemplaris TaxID=2072580 RepID=A0A9X6RLI7_HYPEX|nr:hypothetical protein BV898_16368 [Hypsibius exemplaris]
MACLLHQNESQLSHGITVLLQSAYQRIFIPVFMLFIVVFGVTLNGAGVVDFFKSRLPKTPLNINIVHLFSLNVVLGLTQQVMNTIGFFHPNRGGWVLGNRVCDLYMFCNTIFNALIVNTHGVLALNRTWAIMHPFSYRRLNTKTLSLQVIAGLWIYVLLVTLPLWLMDVIAYRKPVETSGCILNSAAQPVYNTVVVLLISTLPVVVVWVAFVAVIVYKIRRRTILRIRPVHSGGSGTGNGDPAGSTIGVRRRLAKERQSWNFLIMTLLTVAVTVCYGPRTILNALRSFTSISWSSDVQMTTGVLISCQVVVDPVLLMLTLKRLHRI